MFLWLQDVFSRREYWVPVPTEVSDSSDLILSTS
jgi:hypothetical protein